MQHQQQSSRPPAAIPARSRPIEAAADSGFGLLTPSQGNGLINGTPTPLQGSNNSPDLIRGSPITRHSYVNQAVNFSPAHLQQQNQIVRYVCMYMNKQGVPYTLYTFGQKNPQKCLYIVHLTLPQFCLTNAV